MSQTYEILMDQMIYTEYQKFCKTLNNRLTIRCLMLQLGITNVSLFVAIINENLITDLDTEIHETDKIVILPLIAGG